MDDFVAKGMTLDKKDAWVFSQWSGYLKSPGYQKILNAFEAAGSAIKHIHTSGHASGPDLEEFARRMAPRHLVPIHSLTWDQHLGRFGNVVRLRDGEAGWLGAAYLIP